MTHQFCLIASCTSESRPHSAAPQKADHFRAPALVVSWVHNRGLMHCNKFRRKYRSGYQRYFPNEPSGASLAWRATNHREPRGGLSLPASPPITTLPTALHRQRMLALAKLFAVLDKALVRRAGSLQYQRSRQSQFTAPVSELSHTRAVPSHFVSVGRKVDCKSRVLPFTARTGSPIARATPRWASHSGPF